MSDTKTYEQIIASGRVDSLDEAFTVLAVRLTQEDDELAARRAQLRCMRVGLVLVAVVWVLSVVALIAL